MAKSKNLVAVLVLLSIVISAVSGCAAPAPQIVEKEVQVTVEVPKIVEKEVVKEVIVEPPEPIVFTVAHPGGIGTMDPPKAWDWPTVWLHNMLFDCLIWRAADGSGYVPKLAESYENLDDVTWRFKLRPGLTFHNGEKLDTEAVAYTLDRLMTREDFLVYPQWKFIQEVKVIDELTIDVISTGPDANFESEIAMNGCQILPPKYLEEVGEEEFSRNPVGSGPYKLTEFIPDERYVFEAWDDYWGGKPKVDVVIYQAIKETATQVAALLAGQVDLVPSIPLPDLERVAAAEGVKIVDGPANTSVNLVLKAVDDIGEMTEEWPGYQPTTMDVRIRQAVSHALDRALLAEVQGSATPALVRTSCYAPEAFAEKYCFDEATTAWYDPELAKALIKEAGYDPDAGNKPMIHIDYPNLVHGNDKEVGEAIAVMLEDAGFEVEMRVWDYSAYSEQVRRGGLNRELAVRYNSTFFGTIPMYYNCEWRENVYRLPDDQCEDWGTLGAEILVTMDPEKRLGMWEEWQKYYVEDVIAYATILQLDRHYGINEKFEWTPRTDGFLTFRDWGEIKE